MLPPQEDDLEQHFNEITQLTASNLSSVVSTEEAHKLSKLSLPEISQIVNLIAKVLPAGNLPGLIFNGFARLSTRKVPIHKVRNDINALFRGVEQSLDKLVYTTFFAGPAAIIYGYQNILKLAGKTPEDAFPEGIWQFYVDYAMREDTARHANETYGFDSALAQEGLRLSVVDRISVWVMTAIQTLHYYDELLKNEWQERVFMFMLGEITANQPDATQYAELYRRWEKLRPYALPPASQMTYPAYRAQQFEAFLEAETQHLDPELRKKWEEKTRHAKAILLPRYRKQMSIHAFLNPDTYGELRTPLRLRRLNVAIIYRGHYYLFRACKSHSQQPPDLETIRALVAAVVARPSTKPPANLTRFVEVKRAVIPALREKLHPSIIREIDILKTCPIILNCDIRPQQLPLSEIRKGERGAGDHAITIFDTGKTFVFDQSHIFFDGAWGAALAEIMTNEAIRWARLLKDQSPPVPSKKRPYRALIYFDKPDVGHLELVPKINAEAAAETELVNLNALQNVRKVLKGRNEKLKLTVNDLMVLYRAIHAVTYTPAPHLLEAVRDMGLDPKLKPLVPEVQKALNRTVSPPIAIPIDASLRSPRDRLYPMTFTVPLGELNISSLHQQCLATLEAYQNQKGSYGEFEKLQVTYLAMLVGFGDVMNKAKEIANKNETVTAATAKLLAYMPVQLQRLLEQIPERFDILNDIIKGREIFSNVGQVVPSSTLVRFISAKDDTDKKTLCWGIMTDAAGVMRISLRDFRPHVALLEQAGRKGLAIQMTEDYLKSYATGLNQYMQELRKIAEARQ